MDSDITDIEKQGSGDYVEGFNKEFEGKLAECEGGAGVKGTKYAGRQYFSGTLTGRYRDFGSFPWRWYLLSKLTKKPEAYPHDAVWCEEESLTLENE